jgi:hypothetical protein
MVFFICCRVHGGQILFIHGYRNVNLVFEYILPIHNEDTKYNDGMHEVWEKGLEQNFSSTIVCLVILTPEWRRL